MTPVVLDTHTVWEETTHIQSCFGTTYWTVRCPPLNNGRVQQPKERVITMKTEESRQGLAHIGNFMMLDKFKTNLSTREVWD